MSEDFLYKTSNSLEGKRQYFNIGSELSNKIKKFTKDKKSSLNTFFITMLLIYMNKTIYKKDLVIGTPVFNRTSKEQKGMVGMFTSTVPCRFNIDTESKIEDVINLINRELKLCFLNQKYPYDLLIKDLDLIKDGYDSLFKVCVNYYNSQYENKLNGMDVKIKEYYCGNQSYSLQLTIKEWEEDNITLNFDYKNHEYSDEQIRGMYEAIINITNQVLGNENIVINDVNLVNSEENSYKIYDFNSTTSYYPKKTACELFEEQVIKTPDKIALEFKDETLTYKELNEKANQLANYLRGKGIDKHSIIAIMEIHSIELLISILGVLKSGATYLPIDPVYPIDRINYMLEDSKSNMLLTSLKKEDEIKFEGNVINIKDLDLDNYSKNNLMKINDLNDLVYIIYTSGSTGKPKGVMVEQQGLTNYICWANKMYLKDEDEVMALYSSISFDLTVTSIFAPLISGHKIIIYENDETEFILYKILREDKATVVKLTPAHLTLLKDMDNKDSRIKRFIVGGEELKVNLAKDVYNSFDKNIEIYNEYGPTETVVGCMIYKYDESKDQGVAVPIGYPSDNVQIYILDNQLNIVPTGLVGELYISGDGVARGYLNREELTQERFIENPFIHGKRMYKTGDTARYLENGAIEYVGRIDNQIKIRGHRIEIGEIEHRLLAHEAINEAAVILKKNGDTDQYICAYVVCEKELNELSLREYLMDFLPEYMVPSYFIKLDKMPLTFNGKIDRKELLEPNKEDIKNEYVEPRDKLEEKIAEIFMEILNIEKKIGILDNFFELGGHSLKAIVLLSKIHKEFNVRIPIMEVFKSPTIGYLAEFIRGAEKSMYAPIEVAKKSEYYPVSSAQKRLYIIHQMDKATTTYNMTTILKAKGKLDLVRLEMAFKKLIERHESLRTSFLMIDGEVVQKIKEVSDVKFNVGYIDVSSKAVMKYPVERDDNETIERLIKERISEFVTPFDLESGCLFRASVIKVSDDNNVEEHLLMVDMHHIIGDGVSINNLVKDIVRLYSGSNLEKLDLQYKDYAVWQNSSSFRDRIRKEESYWLEKFSDNVPILNLPTDFVRPQLQKYEYEGSYIMFELEESLKEKINELMKQSDTTLYMVLLAALNILLQKYSSQEDILIGSPIAGRTHPSLDNIVGLFVNTLVMRNSPMNGKQFDEFLSEVRDNTLRTFENQNYQFEELISKLNLPRALNRNPLFDVSFALRNYINSEDIYVMPDVKFSPYEYDDNTSKFDLTFYAQEINNKIQFKLEYSTELFLQSTIKRMVNSFKTIIKEIVLNPQIKISDINILSKDQEYVEIIECNRSYSEYPKVSIHELFEKQVEMAPNDIAIEYRENTITYKELDKRANMLAEFLASNEGSRKGNMVGILMDKSDHLLVAILGVLKSGKAYIPIEPSMPEERIKAIIDEAEISMIISNKKNIKRLNRLQWQCGTFNAYLCLDSNDIYSEFEDENVMMSVDLWNHLGTEATNDIEGGAWVSSFTGELFTRAEMDEYANNIYHKAKPYLNKKTKVLEIGCASGLTMFNIAPHVKLYYGTDLSQAIIEKNRERVKNEKIDNIKLDVLLADEIYKLNEDSFDMVIINSVIQSFHGHNYLRDVIGQAIKAVGNKGIILVGDIMDQDLKEELIHDLTEFKRENSDSDYITKTDFPSELFISRKWFEDIQYDYEEIYDVEISNKVHTIENELTKYRYDVVIKIDKTKGLNFKRKYKHKYQFDNSMLKHFEGNFQSIKPKVEDTAYTIYTSGTTGKPKGVMITHQGLVNYIWWAKKMYCKNEKLDFPLYSSIAFDLTVTSIFTPLITGSKVIVMDDHEDSVFTIRKIIEENRVQVIKLTPSHLKLIQDMDCRKSVIKSFIVGGEQLTRSLAQRIYDNFDGNINIYNEYGPTESTVGCMIYKFNPDKDVHEVVPIGGPADNIQIYLLNDHLNPVARGTIGELYIAGDSLSKGYVKNSALTEEKFVENPFITGKKMYKSGDLARRLQDGNIEFLGRSDLQVKVRGYRIEIQDIESCIIQHSQIEDCVIVDILDQEENRYLSAYIVCEKSLIIQELKEYLMRKLPDYMIPAVFIQVDEIPVNRNGKVDKEALLKISKEINVGNRFIPPSNELETEISKIWKCLLGINRIGIDDDFFDMGGNSLKVVSLASKIYENFYVNIPLNKLFKMPTIRQIADYIFETETYKGQEHFYSNNSLTILSENGEQNIFAFPGLGGYGVYYTKLAEMIDTHSLIGFDFIESEDIVDDYANYIVNIQPEGSYVLLGYSAGGNLAFETAKELERRGKEVSHIIMIDSYKNDERVDKSVEEIKERIGEFLDKAVIEGAFNRKYIEGAFRRKMER
ncbi:TPA: amino acid adenylation domain-containing protein, partial [Bacillus cereus]|nr:amino acid adenylation domain-containing protein [Bacillus cereus]